MVTYRLAHSDDYARINAFYNRIYEANRTMEQFLWEFDNGPFGQSIYVIAEDKGEVVGTNCVIPIDLITADGRLIRSGKSEDTLVDPDYRGQKIFYQIYDVLFEKCRDAGIEVVWGFTSAKKPFERLGFDIPYAHQQALAVDQVLKSYRFISSLNVNNGAIDKLKILGLCILSKAKSIISPQGPKSTYRIDRVEALVSGVEELITATQRQVDDSFAIHQSPDFQEWRIYSNPNFFKVHTYGVYDGEKLMALIVFNSHPNGVAYVCQSTFHPDVAHADKVGILRSVTDRIFSEGIALVRTWVFETNKVNADEISVFKEAKYVHLQRGIGLVWKDLSDTGLRPENFILSRIATQGVI